MQSFLRTSVPPAADPALSRHEFQLWRPFFDLGPADAAVPTQVLGVELAFANLEAPDGLQLPVQTRPGAAFRRRLAELSGLNDYLFEDPAALPVPLRTPRWQLLCDLCARFEQLPLAERLAVTGVLSALGLYQYLASLPVPEADDEPDVLIVTAKLAHARSVTDRSRATLESSVQVLEQVAACTDLSVGSRLGAATTLVVLYSQSRLRLVDQVRRMSQTAADLAAQLCPEEDWLDLFKLSTYWRAVSFQPYLEGDVERTREYLDIAEECARRLPADTDQQRWMRDQNFHPLLETRTKEALWASDYALALQRATELRDRDPLDGKVHIQLGDVHLKCNQPEAALDAYLTAASLGVPYRSLAWCKAAAVMPDSADAGYALMCAHRADPRALTPLILLREAACRSGDLRLEAWATHAAEQLGPASAARGQACAQVS